jgi:hypothetical protein
MDIATPPAMEKISAAVPEWLQECIDDVSDLSRQLKTGDGVNQRARAYSFDAASWLQRIETPGERDHADLRAILAHDCAVIPASVCRALAGLYGPREKRRDPDEAAQLALVCIDRSRAAWMAAVRRGLGSASEVALFVTELDALRKELERLLPNREP